MLEIDPTDAPLVFVRNKDPPVRPPILLNPAPVIPTEPPLTPLKLAVPPILSVPALKPPANTKLLDTTVTPSPLKLVMLVVPLDAL